MQHAYISRYSQEKQLTTMQRCEITLFKVHTGWANKNETSLVRPTAATTQGKIKRISPKCSQSLQDVNVQYSTSMQKCEVWKSNAVK